MTPYANPDRFAANLSAIPPLDRPRMAEALGHISMRTKIQPSEIGEMAWFLASDAARHITAQIIGVDGNAEWEG